MPIRFLFWYAVLFGVCLSAVADTYSYDDAGRLTSALQANGLAHSYTPDEEANLQTAGHGGTDTTDANGPGNGIADWWENYFFGARGIDPLATPQGDGVSNLMKFALGLNPLAPASGSPVAFALQTYAGDGKTYPYLTFTRAKDAAALLTVEQSIDLVTWNSGAGYFEQVSVQDLGDGTERIVMRSLTPLPAASSLFFRLKANGGSAPLTAYYSIQGSPAVPALPGWALVCLGIMLPVFAGRYLRGCTAH